MSKTKKSALIVLVIAVIAAVLATGAWASKKEYTSQEIAQMKTQELLNRANEDLLTSYPFDDNYISFTAFDINEVAGILNIDLETASEICTKLDELSSDSPIGSTEPLFVVKKDLTEVYVLYKDKDGMNVEESAVKSQPNDSIPTARTESGWTTDHQEMQGEPILDFGSIKIE